jgi:solute carrier family 35 protein E1
MTDPRQRAPFAHVSSSIDLRGYAGTPPSTSPPRFGNALGVQGGPGYFAPPPPQQQSGFARAANAAGAAFGGLGLARKPSDQGIDTSSPNSLSDAFARIQQFFNGESAESGRGFAMPSAQTLRFVFLCILWYASSAVSGNTGKVILNNFKFPITLTIVQFAFVGALCWIGSSPYLKWTARLRTPTRSIIRHTLPMALFQVGGHIFGSLAISRVPVSTVHTIKALSPCFTVAAYVLLFGVKYSPATYASLVPLTAGVMLACSFDISFNNIGGLICALGSTIIFVSQNIFFKKVMPSPGSGSSGSADHPRLDKINLLFFSSGMAFLLMIPMWLYNDAPRLLAVLMGSAPLPPRTADASAAKVVFTFFVNGTVHFAQILIAFALLASTSPVTYSIASLIKRIAVICLAIIWFNQPVHFIQAVGIALTGAGLWMYNNAKRDVDKGEKRMRQVEAQRDGMLPTTLADTRILDGAATPDYQPFTYASAAPEFLHPPQKDHASPRPVYHHFEPVAKISARPPMYPYPSPPASTASSPPLPPQRDDPISPVYGA